MEIVKFIVALWSHHHNKQSKSWPLLGDKYPLHCWNPSNCSFPQMKSSDSKPRSHVWLCDHTLIAITYIITGVNRMWRKFGLSLSINAVNLFSHLSRGASQFWAFYFLHFGCLINVGSQLVCKTHTCDCIIVLKSLVYH